MFDGNLVVEYNHPWELSPTLKSIASYKGTHKGGRCLYFRYVNYKCIESNNFSVDSIRIVKSESIYFSLDVDKLQAPCLFVHELRQPRVPKIAHR